MKRSFIAIFFMAFLGFVLTGCSGMRVIESDVSAFSTWAGAPPAPGTPYRFERLPSQQAPNAQQDRIEDMARTSLAKVGMVAEPATARFGVQVIFNTERMQRYPDAGFGYGGTGVFFGGGNRGASLGMSFPLSFGELIYKRSLSVMMRDLSTQKVVFETQALQDSPWDDSFSILPAMFDSALLGFPQPPAGARRINVEIPR